MSIEHCGLLSWVHERTGAQKSKNHVQDGWTLIGSRDQRPAILPWFSVFGWRPSLRKSRAPCPLGPAAGLLLDFSLSMIVIGKPVFRFPGRALAHELFVLRKPKTPAFAASCKNAR
jgi:hypothetical protein